MMKRLFLLSFLFLSASAECEDLVDFCDSLQSVCIGSIIQYQLDQLQSVADQLENSESIPALESSLPLIRSENEIPVVASENGNTATPPTTPTTADVDQMLENSLPLLKESLPLIRESLPLIRESLPLIRHMLDPLTGSDKNSCQQKATCKTCRDCPNLRNALTAMVETLCPNTCRVCDSGVLPRDAAADLVKYFQ